MDPPPTGWAAVGPPPRAGPGLPGDPHLPFATRLNLRLAQRRLAIDAVIIAVNGVFAARLLRHPFPGASAWLVFYQAATILDVVWAHLACSRGRPLAASGYLRWHAMTALRLAIRFCDGGTGLCSAAHARLVQGLHSGGGTSSHVRNALVLLYAAGPMHMALNLGVWRLPPLLSIAAQLYIVCTVPRYFHGWCAAGGPLAQPGLLLDAHRLFEGARALLFGSVAPYWLPPPAEPPGLEAQCRCLLTFLLLGGGLALPLLLEAAGTARLFEQHQQQRREARLPAEAGLQPRMYSVVHRLLGGGSLPLAAACFGALVVCWDISTLASLPWG